MHALVWQLFQPTTVAAKELVTGGKAAHYGFYVCNRLKVSGRAGDRPLRVS